MYFKLLRASRLIHAYCMLSFLSLSCTLYFIGEQYARMKDRQNNEPLQSLEDVMCINRQRTDHVKRVCDEKGWTEDIFEGNTTHSLLNLMANDYRKTIYCYLPKVGCSTFKYLLSSEAENITVDKNSKYPNVHHPKYLKGNNMTPLVHYTVAEAKFRLENYYKFIIVRHPFSRLLSAYNNKIYTLGWYVERYADVIDEYLGPEASKRRISFSEFLELIVARTEDFNNPHWKSYYSQCFPCDIRYDQILKLENIDRDSEPVLRHLFGDTAENITTLPKINRETRNNGRPTDPVAEFNKQENETVKNIVNVLKKDFELFGYDWSSDSGMMFGDLYGCRSQ